MAEKVKGKRAIRERIWGRAARLDMPVRWVMLLFVLSSIASMSFTQLGFWPIGVIDDKPVYLMLILGPLVMGSMMFGPVMGLLLGLYAGAVLYLHMMFFPLDYYEIYFITPLTTFGLFPMLGLGAGFMFTLTSRRKLRGATLMGTIVFGCLVLSLIASFMMMANVVVQYGGLSNLEVIRRYLFNSVLGVIVQALVDAVLMAVLCSLASYVVIRVAEDNENRRLFSVFRNWMLVVSSIVFMLASGVIFSVNTQQAQNVALENMLSEAKYLAQHASMLDRENYDMLLSGYDVALDGYIVIMDKAGTILATDYGEVFGEGGSFLGIMGYDEMVEDVAENSEDAVSMLLDSSIDDESDVTLLQDVDSNGVQTMDFLFAAFDHYDDGYVAVLRTNQMVYSSRFNTMLASTLLAIALIVVIAIQATILLNRLVVLRIDETNASLAKITDGHLNERVTVRSTAEFVSLSRGINQMVGALKETISEVEHRNAQDLATAKAIQESALPREFPPFPQIDKFDIYASMKTAKEVGGDFYDFFLIGESDEPKLGFVVADVSGKGIPAALFMMTAKTQLQNFMEADLPLDEAVNVTNHQLCIGNDAGMFVTAWVGLLDYQTGMLEYVNAGHNPPMILSDGSWAAMTDVSGMPLGLFDGMPYESFTRQMEVGDMLYAYTDGVTEAMDVDGRLFGEDRLERTLVQYAHMNPRSVGVGVRRAITDHTKDAEQSDDITMLVLKYGVPPEKRALMVLPAVDTQLVHVFNFVHEELKRRSAPSSAYNPLDIAAEELFVNVCHYAYPDATPDNPGEVRIGFEYEANPPSLTVTISDDGIPYNPLDKPDAVTPDDIADVPIGGLGILMVKRSVDEMSYERVGESNVMTFVKKW